MRTKLAIAITALLAVSAAAQTLTVTRPNGGEWWRTNTNDSVKWTWTGSIANIGVDFSIDNGSTWRTLITSTPNDGSYIMRVPDVLSNTCLIKIYDAADGTPSDQSNATFVNVLEALTSFAAYSGNPVLSPGAGGSWDEHTRERGFFAYEGGTTYKVWYGGWQGTYNTATSSLVDLGYATSSNGTTWTKYGSNPIYTATWIEDVCIVKDGSNYYMYAEDEYTGDADGCVIDRYTSSDGISWTRYGRVLEPTGSGWERDDIGTPTVWKEGSNWYMLYEGIGTTAGQIGLATSSDGITWTRSGSNPVLANPGGTSRDIAIDSEIKMDGVYYIYAHWMNASSQWDAGLYTSTNLTSWTAYSGNPFGYNSPVIVSVDNRFRLYGLNSVTTGEGPYNTSLSSHANALPFADDFNVSALDNYKFLIGTNSGNQSSVTSNELYLQSSGLESGWVITRENFTGANSIAAVKITQMSDEFHIGMTPTYSLSATDDIHGQPNFYKFYLYRPSHSGNYSLYLTCKKNGTQTDLDITGSLTITGAPVYMRIRCDNQKIHLEFSSNGTSWTDTYNETFALPGYSLDCVFHYDLSAYRTSVNGVAHVDDFSVMPRKHSGLN